MAKICPKITYIVFLLLIVMPRSLQASFVYQATRYIKRACINKRLRASAWDGCLKNVKYYVMQGANIDSKDFDRRTALILSAYYGHLDCVQYLVEQGADIEAKDMYAYTPLLWSACNGHFDCLKFLVEHGADINAKNKYSYTALHWGAYKRRLDYIELLVKHGADLHAQNDRGNTACYLSGRNGDEEIARYLAQQMKNREKELR